jgi:hypothetical protein
MEIDIDPQALEIINAILATPYGIAAKLLFYFGAALMIFLMVKRHDMSLWHAVLALVGLKKVPSRDTFFNVLIGVIFIGCFSLMIISMQVVLSVTN